MAFAHLQDAMKVAQDMIVSVGREGAGDARRGAEGAGARHVQARQRPGPVPVAALRRRHQADPVQGIADAVGERLRRHRRDDDRGVVRPAGGRPSVPGRDQGVLHGARPRAARADAVRGHPRPRGVRRDRGRRRAHVERGAAGPAPPRAQAARRTPSSGTSTCASSAACRTRGSAWASSAWSPGSAASSTCGRRSRSRGCCIGSTRSRAVDGGQETAALRAFASTHPPRARVARIVSSARCWASWPTSTRGAGCRTCRPRWVADVLLPRPARRGRERPRLRTRLGCQRPARLCPSSAPRGTGPLRLRRSRTSRACSVRAPARRPPGRVARSRRRRRRPALVHGPDLARARADHADTVCQAAVRSAWASGSAGGLGATIHPFSTGLIQR